MEKPRNRPQVPSIKGETGGGELKLHLYIKTAPPHAYGNPIRFFLASLAKVGRAPRSEQATPSRRGDSEPEQLPIQREQLWGEPGHEACEETLYWKLAYRDHGG